VTEQVGDESFVAFKNGLRRVRRQWLEQGLAKWWGVFEGDQLIGQCGMVECEELGRFQSVETHPDWRRRGVCASLISTVARHALGELGKQRLLLSAEINGPALELYKRLGFRETGQTHSVLKHDRPLCIREEMQGDHAGVRSLTIAAFEGVEQAELIDMLRGSDEVISIVGEQTNSLLGHVLFSKVCIEGPGSNLSAVALAPLAVSPNFQGRGVGTRLVLDGLVLCKSAGHDLCLVLGDSAYYSRFGFVPAVPHGLNNPWGGDDGNFMVCELTENALSNCSGRPIYHVAFSAL
jgi:putative acetyltransferase